MHKILFRLPWGGSVRCTVEFFARMSSNQGTARSHSNKNVHSYVPLFRRCDVKFLITETDISRAFHIHVYTLDSHISKENRKNRTQNYFLESQ